MTCIANQPILGIETSCDETAAAVVVDRRICSNAIFPKQNTASTAAWCPNWRLATTIRALLPVVDRALSEANVELRDLGGIAVTQGPGLIGCLLVGVSVGKGLALGAGLPLVGIHHIEGHLFAGAMAHPDLLPPFMALVVSGGHTELIGVSAWGHYERWGRTRDDAAGEAFDKVAKILGLLREGEVTMGGPPISALAEKGDPEAFDFPRGLMNDPGFDFSFSGLKTSVLYRIRDLAEQALAGMRADIAASFQAAVIDVLVDKTLRAARAAGVERVLLSGGVAANRALRARLDAGAGKLGMGAFYPPAFLCTDNAAMIAGAGAFRLARGEVAGGNLTAAPRLPLPGLRDRQV